LNIRIINKHKIIWKTIIKEVVHLTAQDFKEKVFDYEKGSEWKYEGNLPAIVDFYADWCQPCKMIAPVLEELALEYAGKIVVYKVDTENEQDWHLYSVFRVFLHFFSFQRRVNLNPQWVLYQNIRLKK